MLLKLQVLLSTSHCHLIVVTSRGGGVFWCASCVSHAACSVLLVRCIMPLFHFGRKRLDNADQIDERPRQLCSSNSKVELK